MPAVRASSPSSARDMWTLRPSTVTVTSLDRAISGPGREAMSRLQAGPQVQAEDPADPVAIQHAALTQLSGAAGGLLRRLEEEEHVPGQLGQMLRRILRQGQDHGGVGIVAAGMHPPGMDRGVGQVRGLRHRKRVQLRPKCHGIALPCVEPGADAAGDGREHPAGRGAKMQLGSS